MADSNQSLRVNGQKLSNLDPDLVITLDDHPVVQISKILESTITYSFLGNVEQETTYSLNLTFLYKGTHKLVVPMTFIHKPKTMSFEIDPNSISGDTGDEFTLAALLDYNGEALALNTEGVVIALGDNDAIKIVDGSIGSSSIKVSVIKDVTADETVEVKITATYDTMTAEDTLTVNLKAAPEVKPTLADLQSPMTMNLWESKPLSFKVMLNDTDITSSITDIVPTNQTDINDKFEFVKLSDTSWGYQSVKSDTESQVTATGTFDVKVTYQTKDYLISGSVDLVTNVNDGSIPTNRFNVEML